jgi:hypothetical protein
MGYFCNFQKTFQSKQSPNGQKFAESGHPGHNEIGGKSILMGFEKRANQPS